MRIKAFQGLRPTPQQAAQVASLPYDVINTAEARELAAGNPASFLHVVRAEIDLPEGTDLYSDPVYQKARENLERLQSEGYLVRESEPCLYIYEQEWKGLRQRGVTAVCHVQDYLDDVIKKHEKTRKAKEDDRTKLNSTLSAHPGPVFLTYRDVPEINALVEQTVSSDPFINFTAVDGVRHTIWRVPGGEALTKAFAKVPVSYVADGHHRSASAARVGKERAEANPSHTGEEDYNWFLAVLFPASELNVLSYNRVVRDLNGLSPAAFLEKLGQAAELTANATPDPQAPGDVRVYLEGQWYGLKLKVSPEAGPIEQLDAYVLQQDVLTPILAIDDPRTSDRVDFIGGIRGTQELVKLVDNGQAAAAFSMYPVTIKQLMDIADAGEIMPPKSTWFEPKLRSGLFVHTF